jgi:hypothetical protein
MNTPNMNADEFFNKSFNSDAGSLHTLSIGSVNGVVVTPNVSQVSDMTRSALPTPSSSMVHSQSGETMIDTGATPSTSDMEKAISVSEQQSVVFLSSKKSKDTTGTKSKGKQSAKAKPQAKKDSKPSKSEKSKKTKIPPKSEDVPDTKSVSSGRSDSSKSAGPVKPGDEGRDDLTPSQKKNRRKRINKAARRAEGVSSSPLPVKTPTPAKSDSLNDTIVSNNSVAKPRHGGLTAIVESARPVPGSLHGLLGSMIMIDSRSQNFPNRGGKSWTTNVALTKLTEAYMLLAPLFEDEITPVSSPSSPKDKPAKDDEAC